MDSYVQRAEQQIGSDYTKFRWALGLSGALSIALGVVILIWPGISLFALTILVGAYMAATGGLRPGRRHPREAAAAARLARLRERDEHRGRRARSRLAEHRGGLRSCTSSAPTRSRSASSWPGARSGFRSTAATRALLLFSGFVSILFGIVMFANPGAGALVTLALIAAFALVVGLSEVVMADGREAVGRVAVEQGHERGRSAGEEGDRAAAERVVRCRGAVQAERSVIDLRLHAAPSRGEMVLLAVAAGNVRFSGRWRGRPASRSTATSARCSVSRHCSSSRARSSSPPCFRSSSVLFAASTASPSGTAASPSPACSCSSRTTPWRRRRSIGMPRRSGAGSASSRFSVCSSSASGPSRPGCAQRRGPAPCGASRESATSGG